LLTAAGFSWKKDDGALIDRQGTPVEFSIITSSSSSERTEMATMIQQDLREVGIRLQVVPLEFHSLLDRVLQTHDYEAAIMGLGGGDVDPNSQMNVWLSSGDDHLWNPGQAHPATPWEAELDRLMKQQMSTLAPRARKLLYDRVQQIETEEVPVVFLVSPNLLVGAKDRLRGFKPAILDSHTLWNSEQLFVQDRTGAGQ
jgi:peptide/nickel transport system substrate-binding protein